MIPDLGRYKAVFFDAGDTLLTIPAAHELMHSYFLERQFKVDVQGLKRVLSEAMTRFYYENKAYSNQPVTAQSDRDFWVEVYRNVLDRLEAGKVWSEAEIHAYCDDMYDLFVSPDHYTLFDDVTETIAHLHRRGFQLGIVSNFAPTLRHIFERYELLHYFDPFIVSTEVGLEKPNPEIFAYALRSASLEASDVLYIGDHEVNDLWAPQQVGIDAVRIMRYEGMSGEGIRSLYELLDAQALSG